MKMNDKFLISLIKHGKIREAITVINEFIEGEDPASSFFIFYSNINDLLENEESEEAINLLENK